MSNKKQILLAFFIPLFLAIVLSATRIYIFYDLNIIYTYPEVAFAIHDKVGSPMELEILGLLVWGMILLSFVLPSFVMMRTYQSRKNKLNSALHIE